ncbi:MAG TPA: cupin domain-containing protein [Steroidobacter sp.]
MNAAKLSLAALVLLLPSLSQAIEPSEKVKVTALLKTTTTWDGAPLSYPEGQAELTGLVIVVQPGGETGWHEHPVPSFGLVLEGTLEVTLKDGKVKRIEAGEAVAEVVGTVHNSRAIGDKPVKLVVFYAGAAGTPVTISREDGSKTR